MERFGNMVAVSARARGSRIIRRDDMKDTTESLVMLQITSKLAAFISKVSSQFLRPQKEPSYIRFGKIILFRYQ